MSTVLSASPAANRPFATASAPATGVVAPVTMSYREKAARFFAKNMPKFYGQFVTDRARTDGSSFDMRETLKTEAIEKMRKIVAAFDAVEATKVAAAQKAKEAADKAKETAKLVADGAKVREEQNAEADRKYAQEQTEKLLAFLTDDERADYDYAATLFATNKAAYAEAHENAKKNRQSLKKAQKIPYAQQRAVAEKIAKEAAAKSEQKVADLMTDLKLLNKAMSDQLATAKQRYEETPEGRNAAAIENYQSYILEQVRKRRAEEARKQNEKPTAKNEEPTAKGKPFTLNGLLSASAFVGKVAVPAAAAFAAAKVVFAASTLTAGGAAVAAAGFTLATMFMMNKRKSSKTTKATASAPVDPATPADGKKPAAPKDDKPTDTPKKKRGCLFWGATALLTAVGVGAALMFNTLFTDVSKNKGTFAPTSKPAVTQQANPAAKGGVGSTGIGTNKADTNKAGTSTTAPGAATDTKTRSVGSWTAFDHQGAIQAKAAMGEQSWAMRGMATTTTTSAQRLDPKTGKMVAANPAVVDAAAAKAAAVGNEAGKAAAKVSKTPANTQAQKPADKTDGQKDGVKTIKTGEKVKVYLKDPKTGKYEGNPTLTAALAKQLRAADEEESRLARFKEIEVENAALDKKIAAETAAKMVAKVAATTTVDASTKPNGPYDARNGIEGFDWVTVNGEVYTTNGDNFSPHHWGYTGDNSWAKVGKAIFGGSDKPTVEYKDPGQIKIKEIVEKDIPADELPLRNAAAVDRYGNISPRNG